MSRNCLLFVLLAAFTSEGAFSETSGDIYYRLQDELGGTHRIPFVPPVPVPLPPPGSAPGGNVPGRFVPPTGMFPRETGNPALDRAYSDAWVSSIVAPNPGELAERRRTLELELQRYEANNPGQRAERVKNEVRELLSGMNDAVSSAVEVDEQVKTVLLPVVKSLRDANPFALAQALHEAATAVGKLAPSQREQLRVATVGTVTDNSGLVRVLPHAKPVFTLVTDWASEAGARLRHSYNKILATREIFESVYHGCCAEGTPEECAQNRKVIDEVKQSLADFELAVALADRAIQHGRIEEGEEIVSTVDRFTSLASLVGSSMLREGKATLKAGLALLNPKTVDRVMTGFLMAIYDYDRTWNATKRAFSQLKHSAAILTGITPSTDEEWAEVFGKTLFGSLAGGGAGKVGKFVGGKLVKETAATAGNVIRAEQAVERVAAAGAISAEAATGMRSLVPRAPLTTIEVVNSGGASRVGQAVARGEARGLATRALSAVDDANAAALARQNLDAFVQVLDEAGLRATAARALLEKVLGKRGGLTFEVSGMRNFGRSTITDVYYAHVRKGPLDVLDDAEYARRLAAAQSDPSTLPVKRPNTAGTFLGARYFEIVPAEREIFFRIGGPGGFWSRTPAQSIIQAGSEFGVLPEWSSSMRNMTVFVVPKDFRTHFYEGLVGNPTALPDLRVRPGSQFFAGGGNQIIVPYDLWRRLQPGEILPPEISRQRELFQAASRTLTYDEYMALFREWGLR